jgi:ketosteroid isomerase-like protein
MKAWLLAIPLLLAASAGQAADLKTVIEGANKRWIDAFNRGDAAAVTALYTDTATVLPPGTGMVHGRDAVLAFWKGAIDSGMKVTALTTVSVERQGAFAKEIGRVVAEAPGPDKKMAPVEGKYVVVWRVVKGVWKLDADIWNLDK